MSFGSGAFGTSQQQSGGIFGGQQPQTTPTTNLFGGGSSLFGGGGGQQKAFTFGGLGGTTSQQQGGGMFGTQSTTPATSNIFGGGAAAKSPGTGGFFGSSQQQTTPTTGLFQAPSTQPTGSSVPFNPEKGHDSVTKAGVTSNVPIVYQCLSIMKQYEHKSLEELRWEDYQLGRHRKTTTTLGGTGLLFGSSTPPTAPPPPNLFSSGGASVFGGTSTSTPPTNTAFGSTGLFGQQTSSNTAGAGGLFGSALGNQQPKPFGGTNAFGVATSTPPQTNLFGLNTAASTPPAKPAFTFGGTTPTASPLFSSTPQQQQPQQGFGLFGQASTAPATGSTVAPTNLFGGAFGTAAAAPSKPLFGGFGVSTPTTTSTTAAPATTFGTGLFAPTAITASQPSAFQSFGATTSTAPAAPPTTNFFGLTSSNANPPSTGGFLFPNVATQQQQPQRAPAFFQNTPTPPQQTTNQFRPTFGGNFGGSVPSSNFGSGFAFQPPQQQQQQVATPNYQALSPIMPGPVISFATTPFKDNKLFYGLLPEVNLKRSRHLLTNSDERVSSNAATREFALRRQRLWNAGGPGGSIFNISSAPAVRRLTFINRRGKENSLTKFKIFDGFEEEDLGVGVNILAPKTNVKILDLQSLKDPLIHIPLGGDPTQSSATKRWSERYRAIEAQKEEKRRQREQQPTLTFLQEEREKEVVEQAKKAEEAMSPLLQRHRRVRFTLPSVSTEDGGGTNPVLFPGREDGDLGENWRNSSGDTSRSPTTPEGEPPKEAGSVCGVVNTRNGYYLKPSLEELDKKVDAEGNCIVTGLEIGRENFGRIRYLCPVNIANVDVDKIVHFRHKEVVVYPNDDDKPSLGHGLNVPAEIHLERVWPLDKESNELIRDPDHKLSKNYEKKLYRACQRMGADFLGYDCEQGIWTFRIAQF